MLKQAFIDHKHPRDEDASSSPPSTHQSPNNAWSAMMQSKKRNPRQQSIIISALLAMCISPLAQAVECRAIPSVQVSAISANNNAAGGHLNQHVFGARPPQGKSQANKTLFTSIQEYTGFWNNYSDPRKFTGTAETCSGNSARQKVTVYSVLKKDLIGGYNCSEADAHGECTKKTRAQFSNVQLDFEVINGQWILLTAYPTN